MRKIFQAIFALVLLLTVSLFAQNMCIELCTPCQNKKDQTCKKVDKRCHCAALLDSISAAQASKDATFAESINRLSDELLQTCDETVCARNISFESGLFKEIKQGPSPVSNETKQNLYETKFNNTQPEMSRIEPLPPMTEECSGFCGDCPVTDKMLKAKQPKFKDKFCKKIEQSCKCIDYAINKKQLAEQAKADSVAEFERKLQRIENASVLAKQIQEHSINDSACTLTVVFANSEMAALDIQKAKEIVKEKKQESATTVKENIAEEQPTQFQETSKPTTENEKEDVWASYSQKSIAFQEDSPSSTNKETKTDKVKNSFFGISLAFASLTTSAFYGKPLQDLDGYFEFGANLGFFHRIYFNRIVSFNYGLNAEFHHGWYCGFVDFSTIMAEIPLGFRFGIIPLGTSQVSLFLSANFHIRKPIFLIRQFDSENVYNDFASFSEWEFINLLGFGIEITRHFSLEFQLFAGNFRIYEGPFGTDAEQSYLNGSDSWRIKIDFAF
ncbi:hypothetical protein [Fibrobacter sp. UWB3]|uniref:hypothetical protein n=1 Tax=Fibrobacter sp. UWB3 TaxID=1964357 RepID=UPI000B5220FA|nr:hypothetical protein [Fibrobacter sp. UWB3]OWV18560.1 hypothetical protein B7991_10125 [Fibrobacter sp. UWB3]